MNYEFSDAPIVSRRIDRRTSKQKKWAKVSAQKKQDLKQEIYSVKDLVAQGFYNSSTVAIPFGIEVWTRKSMKRDKLSHFEWEERKIHTLSLSLPSSRSCQYLANIRPLFWEDSATYYWSFHQRPIVAMWCVLDLLQRLLYLPHWDKVNSIPLRWSLGNEKTLAKARFFVDKINKSGQFNIPPPPIKWMGSLNATRHQATPYDYEWTTGKRERNEAKNHWDSAIQNTAIA
jgi:hypothetical protein